MRIAMYVNVVDLCRHYVRWVAQRQVIHEASHHLGLQAQQIRVDRDTGHETAQWISLTLTLLKQDCSIVELEDR